VLNLKNEDIAVSRMSQGIGPLANSELVLISETMNSFTRGTKQFCKPYNKLRDM